MVGAIEMTVLIMTLDIIRRSGGKAEKATAKTVGIIAPPTKPCSARVRIMVSMSDDRPVKTLIMTKPVQEIMNSLWVPHHRAR